MNELSRRIGKFDSPESLLKAYESLQSEFTKRSQRLKETEKENQQLKQDLGDTGRLERYALDALTNEDFVKENVLTKEEIRKQVIGQYLTLLNNEGSAKILNSATGRSVLTPPPRPATLSEAKRLADMIINS